jgi:hypothetical protein
MDHQRNLQRDSLALHLRNLLASCISADRLGTYAIARSHQNKN